MKNIIAGLFFISIELFAIGSLDTIHSEDKSIKVSVSSGDQEGAGNKQMNKLNKIVFGFLPTWEYQANTHKSIRYDLLTHIAIMPFESDSLGNLTKPLNWPWTDVINSARAEGTKIIITVTNFEGRHIHQLMKNADIRNNLFNNIRIQLLNDGLDGVNFDFENLLDSDKDIIVKNFISFASDYFKKINERYEISFSSPISGGGLWDFQGMLEKSDYLFIMGYDFYGSWSETTGPSAPLTGPFYSIAKSLIEEYKTNIQANASKLILGVPYYGNIWKTKTDKPYSSVKKFIPDSTNNDWQGFFFLRDIENFSSYEQSWDDLSQTSWIKWQDSIWNQIWFDGVKSLELKYDLVIQQKMAGIGIWALGYDNGRTEYWDLITKKFTGVSNLAEIILPNDFQLYQNYPNPFNPESDIRYTIDQNGYVSLKLFDMLGREIITLVDESKLAGTHQIRLNADDLLLSSGVYFYTLRSNGKIQTKSMTLVK